MCLRKITMGNGISRNVLPTVQPATIPLAVTSSPTKPESPKPYPGVQPVAGGKRFDSVPLLDLHRQYLQVQDKVVAAIERVCSSQQYILGAEVEGLERELANFCGAGDAVGCASGTDALWLALAAAGVQPGDQVLTTPFSFFASASAIVRAGARPVFADIDPRTFNLDPAQRPARQTPCVASGSSLWTVRRHGFTAKTG